jgi:hypothetical protein
LSDLISDDEVAFHLPLTPRELKVTHSALKAFLNDFGHDEREIHDIVRGILARMPDEASIRLIDLDSGS